MTRKYISAVETAKLIRTQLKNNFPAIKFYVRSDHNSIDIDWIDGPATKKVESIVNPFSGGGFDGMIDLEYSVTSWLLPDGSAIHAHSEGTTDSHGSVPDFHSPAPKGSVEVQFGAKYIFTHHHYTPEYAKPIIKAVCDEYGVGEPTYYEHRPCIGRKQLDTTTLDWDCRSEAWRDLDFHVNQEIHKRLAGEQPTETETLEEITQPEPVKVEEPKTEESKTIEVSYERDWTWIKVPAQDDEALRNTLKNSLHARWSFRRLAWFITETIEEGIIISTLNSQPAPILVSTKREIPSRVHLYDD